MKQETKMKFIEFLSSRGEYFKKVHESQFRIRCPFCGDSTKNLNEGHLYIKCDLTDESSVQYNCFKCGEHSHYLTKELIELLGCDEELKSSIQKEEKKTKSYQKNPNDIIIFPYKCPPNFSREEKLHYIDNRLGISFSENDYSNMKVITSYCDFIEYNKIDTVQEPYVVKMLEKNYIGFLTSGNSHILFRDITDTEKYSWLKYPIVKDSKLNHVFYTHNKEPIDVLSEEEITINLSEGVFDTLGISYHLGHFKKNTMNISVCGNRYDSIIQFIIHLSLIGSNISINVFLDNDEKFNKNNNSHLSSFPYMAKVLEKYKPLFKRITLYHNLLSKDYGVPKKEIMIEKRII